MKSDLHVCLVCVTSEADDLVEFVYLKNLLNSPVIQSFTGACFSEAFQKADGRFLEP